MSAQKWLKVPFAVTGDKVAIPDDVQPSGAMSWSEGFGVDYERDPATDPLAKRIPRDETNQYLFDITHNIHQYQIAGFPEWITPAQNGGAPVTYTINAYVRHNGPGGGNAWVVYVAKINGATLEPGVAAGWANEWTVQTPVDGSTLKATQQQTNEGTGTGLTGAVEIVKSAREGKWLNYGTGVWNASPGQLDLTVPGGAAFNIIPGTTLTFAVPTANTVAGLTLKVGVAAPGGLQNQDGSIIAIGDLQPNFYYHATVSPNGAFWKIHETTTSVLARFSASGDGAIFGYLATNTAGNLNTHITFSTGNCRDSTNQRNIPRTAPMTKALNAVWAQGSGNGGRDQAGAPAANETWHAFAILNDATQVTDVLFSKSIAAPTLPGGYTFFRRVFSFIVDASAIIRQFVHYGDFVALKNRGVEWAATTNGVAAGTLRSVGVPTGMKVLAVFYYSSQNVGGSAASPAFSGIYDPDVGVPVFGGSFQWAQIRVSWGADVNMRYATDITQQWTNTNAQVYTASNDTGDNIAGGVLGWWDYRGRMY